MSKPLGTGYGVEYIQEKYKSLAIGTNTQVKLSSYFAANGGMSVYLAETDR